MEMVLFEIEESVGRDAAKDQPVILQKRIYVVVVESSRRIRSHQDFEVE